MIIEKVSCPSSKEEVIKQILENQQVFNSVEEYLIHELIHGKVSKDVDCEELGTLTFGQRCADHISIFVGSWTFIIIAIGCIFVWVTINIIHIIKPFDPYPFILLNLFLSCIAAIQAPIIMMSQNREAYKDRTKSRNDFKVNFKSEILIEDLHNKVDSLMENQTLILECLYKLQNEEK